MSNNFEVEDLLSKFSEPQKLASLLNLTTQQNGDLLSKSSPEVMKLVLKYATLTALSSRSESDDDCIGKILEVAGYNEVLSFWIVEVDHFLGHTLGLLNEDSRESYRNQQALLRDYAGTANFPTPTDQQTKNYLTPCKPELYTRDDDPVPC